MYDEEQYKKSWDGPLLRCIPQEDIPKILVEVHQGWRGSHIGGRSRAEKLISALSMAPRQCSLQRQGDPHIDRLGSVMRKMALFAHSSQDQDKLNPKWEISYRISRILSPGTYELEKMNGDKIPRTWHASNLAIF
ncbi:hypothetical protein LIER_13940 [Lithospermum erythrorhizon]|uniref:Uncharacterized protein n=1 Tax=Lithospermum erythrorhizon TaxID=34254 RepID=A0AAV3Q1E7_LITER